MTTQLKGVTWQNPRGYDPLVVGSSLWQIDYSDVDVLWEQLPWYRFEEEVLRSLQSNEGKYDLIMFDHPWTGKLASEGWLIPWEDLVDTCYLKDLSQRVVPPSTESYYLYERHWALPLDGACHAGLYRQDLCETDELPHTWEEIKAWAEAHLRSGDFYPLVLNLEGVLGCCLFLSMMAGLGHPAFEEEEQIRCDSECTRYVLSLLRELIPYTPPGSTHWGPWDIYEAMTTRDDIAFSPSIFAYANYFQDAPRQSALRLCRVPDFQSGGCGRPILGGVGLGIASSTAHPQLAASLSQFLMKDSVQLLVFTLHNGQPATCSSWNDPKVNNDTHGFYSQLAKNMETAYTRPRYPLFHAVELQVGRILQEFWDDAASLDATVRQLNAL